MILGELHILRNLPQEIWRDILRRLPIRSIMRFKHVCKSWRDLIEGGDFTTSYTPKPGVAFDDRELGYTVWDEACQLLFRFRLPPPHNQAYPRVVIGSANGLLMFRGLSYILIICNPVTREYIELPPLPTDECIYGFGVSKLSGQYKILCFDNSRSCHVYTLGRGGEGLWRSIPEAATRLPYTGGRVQIAAAATYRPPEYAVFLNGNLHWLASASQLNHFVCCFDLETELFASFSLPPRDYGGGRYADYGQYILMGYGNRSRTVTYREYRLYILEGRLTLCDYSEDLNYIVIWWMNSYGDTNSWVKIYASPQSIFKIPYDIYDVVLPLDALFAVNIDYRLFIFTKNTQALAHPPPYRTFYYFTDMAIYTPSFLSLKTMGVHDVKSLIFD